MSALMWRMTMKIAIVDKMSLSDRFYGANSAELKPPSASSIIVSRLLRDASFSVAPTLILMAVTSRRGSGDWPEEKKANQYLLL